jgi:hypothetical protein
MPLVIQIVLQFNVKVTKENTVKDLEQNMSLSYGGVFVGILIR